MAFLHIWSFILFDLNYIFLFFFFTGWKNEHSSFWEMYFEISNPNPNPQIKGQA